MVLFPYSEDTKENGTDVFVEYYDNVLMCFLQNMRKRQRETDLCDKHTYA